MIEITPELGIPQSELVFTASRSSGPGGQNVNKLNTRVTLQFDVDGSPSLSDEQKRRVRSRLASRINKQGVLRVVSQQSRSQAANAEAALARFVELLRGSLREPKRRRPTRVPQAAKHRRLEAKRQRGQIKRQRRGRDGDV